MTFTAPIVCSGKIIKAGKGTLKMNVACPDMTGGLRIDNGGWRIGDAGGFGTGTVTINGGAAQFDLADATTHVANDFVITKPTISSSQLQDEEPTRATQKTESVHLYFIRTASLDGSVTSANVNFRINGERFNDSSSAQWATINLYGEVNAGASATIYTYGGTLGCYARLHFYNKLTCGTLDTGNAYSGCGDVYLHAANAIGYCKLNAANVHLGDKEALTPRIFHQSCWDAGRGSVKIETPHVRMAAVSSNQGRSSSDDYPSGSGKTGATIVATPEAATLEVTGLDANYMTYARLQGQLTFLLNAEAYPNFKETFDWVTSSTTGDIIVSNGTLRVQRGAGFPSVKTVVVGPNGAFEHASANGLQAVTRLVIDGKFTLEDGFKSPFTDGQVALELGPNALLKIPEGMVLNLLSCTVDGEVREGRLSAANCPQVTGGVLYAKVNNPRTATWTGGGADDLLGTGGNWEGDETPDLLSGAVVPTFASSGVKADVDGPVKFAGLDFTAPDGFTLAAADADASLEVGDSGVKAAAAASGKVYYDVQPPTTFIGAQKWELQTNAYVRFRNASILGGSRLDFKGQRGHAMFEGETTLSGGAYVSNQYLHVSGRVKGAGEPVMEPQSSGSDKAITVCYRAKLAGVSDDCGLVCSNATVELPLVLDVTMGVNGVRGLAHTTNDLMCPVVLDGYYSSLTAELGAEIRVRGGLISPLSVRPTGKGVVRVMDKPVVIAGTGVGWNHDEGTVSFDVAGNSFNYLCSGYYSGGSRRPVVAFGVDDAMTNGVLLAAYHYGYDAGPGAFYVHKDATDLSTIALNGTKQRPEYLYIGKQGVVTGDCPAEIEVTKGGVRGADVPQYGSGLAESYVGGEVNGWVKLSLSGAGSLTLTNKVFASYGDLEVSNGTLAFASDASWPNGTNLIVRGTGTLRIGQSKTFGNQAVLRFADSGKLSIPDGKRQKVAECWVGDTKVETGIYSAADLKEGDALYGHLTSGTLRVGKVGGLLLVR